MLGIELYSTVKVKIDALGISYLADEISDDKRKGMSLERTFPPMTRESDMLTLLEDLSHKLAEDLKAEGLKGRTVTLKLKTTDFQVLTRSKTVEWLVWKGEDVFRLARQVL